MKKHCTAIVLAGGKGTRMGADVPKQYLSLAGRPLIWYSLQAVEQSNILDDCILVTAREDMELMRTKVLEKYGFRKVLAMAPGGAERYESVLSGLRMLEELQSGCDAGLGRTDYVFIQDGARPFLTEEILRRNYETALECGTAVTAVRAKDTVKIADERGFVVQTPDRNRVWNMQTPQTFRFAEIREAYEKMMVRVQEERCAGRTLPITDDAQVMELFGDLPVRLAEGSYDNFKVTTPEDLRLAESMLAGDGSRISNLNETVTENEKTMKAFSKIVEAKM
ncbi:MAG: 2-C-methyl-D-erythritol 4-phosphate cytidylyltransferase [Lachnospiraceae bacterium]|nr:2-C-methyl-D-erythritol 4-phosphate cytidylyltransferase [Lachnospiraceae bacterium]